MAFTNFTPVTLVQQAQDGKGLKLWDASTWSGESALCTKADVVITYVDGDGIETEYDAYPLIVDANKDKFNEYLDIDGHIIETAYLTIDGVAASLIFPDGYYIIKTIYDDGTYSESTMPYYENEHAFLAKLRCMARVLPKVLSWPMTEDVYRKNRDIFMINMYLMSAENDADLGRIESFRKTIALIQGIFEYYSIEECF